MKKILIFYASYGGGHLNAAKSINEYLTSNYNNIDIDVEFIDCVKYVNKTIEKITTAAYREAAKLMPWVWGKVYSDSQKGPLAHLTSRSNQVLAIKLLKLLRAKKPDLIISTHPFGSQMCTYLKRKNKISAKIATIMTDYSPHDQWLVGHEHTDFFFVAHKDMKQQLVEKGISENSIYPFGIPLSKRFKKLYNRLQIFEQFDLDPNKKTLLFFGGGEFGLGKTKVFEILRHLISTANNIQIVAIAGKNEKMKDVFNGIVSEYDAHNFVKVLAFSDKIPELMNICDIVITKPGGMTTTESLTSNLPMIIINPIPGQEEENAEFLENNNVAIWVKKDTDLNFVINSIIYNDSKINQMKENISKLAKIDSTENICDILINSIK